VLDLPAWLANGGDFLATRVSYKLNLQGPSISIGTGCSTSLVAIHMACQSLLAGECEMALAGGVAAGTRQARGYLYADGGIMSPDGHCRAFDAASRGAVAGSGVGVVVLRRLEDALADGDPIRAVIRGSAINNDGGQKVSYTAPRAQGQADVIVEAMEVAGVPPETIGYVEGHGSGTVLGDPIEVEALTRAFRTRTQRRQFCAIGSVKTNVGHLDTAAGVAGLIKTVLGLEHGEIPPSLHFQEPNPQIDFAGSPFFVADRLLPWPAAEGTPRRAGVSSFGIGGTNAHVVLEEAPPAEPADPGLPWQLVAVSARTATALETATDNLASHLMENPELPLADAAYTLLQGRRGWEHRRVVVCADTADAASALATRDPARVFTRVAEAGHRPVAFLFSGLGDQYPGMTRGVYDSVPAYRQAVDRCIRVARERLGIDLGAALLSAEEPRAERGGLDMRRMMARAPEGPRFASAELAHAAVFTVEYALAQLWMSWGVRPEAMIGHSLGEYAAACVAGVFEVEDALELVVRRARLIDTLPAGGMLAVPLAEAEVAALLPDGVDVAAANAPGLTVVSGSTAGIEEMERVLEARGVISRRVATTRPFHSRQMSPAADEMARLVAAVPRRAPSIPFLSNVTGDWITPEEATDPAYWARHLCSTVRFADGVGRLLDEPRTVLLEVGPGQTLGSFARQCAAGRGPSAPWCPRCAATTTCARTWPSCWKRRGRCGRRAWR
jgi:acyl transferase domain-containing protein